MLRGHDTENPRPHLRLRPEVGVFGVIKRELRLRSAIEPVTAISRPKPTSDAAISRAVPAMPLTPSSPPSETTSAASSPG